MREVKEGRGSPHGGVFLDIAWIKERLPNARRAHQEEAPEHVPPVQGAGGHRHHARSRWRSGRRRTTSWAACASTPTRRCRRCRACSRRASAPRACTARTASAATRSPTCSCSASAPASTRRDVREGARRRRRRRRTQVEAAARRGARAVRARRRGGENPYTIQHDLQEMMQDLVGIVRTRGRDAARRSSGIAELRERAARVRRRRATASTTPAGTRRSTCATCSPSPRRSRARRSSARRAAARTSATTSRTKDAELRQGQHRASRKGAGRRDADRARAAPADAAPSCKQIIEEMK